MKIPLVFFTVLFLITSCTNRNERVNKNKLLGNDYRLFQDTPAWELAKAVQDENEKQIIGILAKQSKLIDYQEPKYGNTLLMLTVKNQQMKSFKILLANKSDVNIHNTYDGASALIEACGSKYYDFQYAETLLQRGASVNDAETGERREGSSTRFTPLMAASQSGRLDLIKLLISKGADVNYKNEYKETALSKAIMTERYKVAIYLLEKGADYKQPIFYRPGDSVPYRPEDDKPMFLVDVLREDFFEIGTDEYKYKMQIANFLKSKGIDYRTTPIPEYIRNKAQEEYPNHWQEYLEKY